MKEMLEYSLNGQFISDNLSCIYMHVNFGRNIYASMYIFLYICHTVHLRVNV